jgi:hypothetical protein
MGKTTPTFRDQLSTLQSNWESYRRVLRRRSKPAYDELWTQARTHADAGGAANPPEPMHAALLSICLEQQQQINNLEEDLERIRDD